MEERRSRCQDAAYTAIGFAVIGVQRLQVQRREAETRLRCAISDRSLAPVVDGVLARAIPVGQEVVRVLGRLASDLLGTNPDQAHGDHGPPEADSQ